MKKLLLLVMAGSFMLFNYAGATSLSISTGGRTGATSSTHTFTAQASTKSIKVTYRFITSEVPGGYFGSQYNDYYSVVIQSPGANASDASSMNALGLGAFTTNGSTGEKNLTLEVEGGAVVQITGTVANVGDQYYDSQLVVESIEEVAINVESASLQDIDGTALEYFSSDDHPFFNSQTPVRGKIKIVGPENVSVTEVELNLIQGGATVATGVLHPDASANILTTFGADKKIEIATSTFLFNVPATNDINTTNGSTISLQLRVEADNDNEILHDLGSVNVLGRYTGTNRYGTRQADAAVGGDSWALPRVVTFAGNFSTHSFGDFSNMHGGQFAPHASHRTGNDIDGWFAGYNARNAATAQTLINVLNGDHGTDIERMFVTYSQQPTDTFWTTIQDVTLNDGRAATDVIRSVGGHTTHYHWRIN
ncbi:MAG: hypothetical protein P8X74_19300 [Reinekea sp.]|jgi:hypothetical protein